MIYAECEEKAFHTSGAKDYRAARKAKTPIEYNTFPVMILNQGKGQINV